MLHDAFLCSLLKPRKGKSKGERPKIEEKKMKEEVSGVKVAGINGTLRHIQYKVVC